MTVLFVVGGGTHDFSNQSIKQAIIDPSGISLVIEASRCCIVQIGFLLYFSSWSLVLLLSSARAVVDMSFGTGVRESTVTVTVWKGKAGMEGAMTLLCCYVSVYYYQKPELSPAMMKHFAPCERRTQLKTTRPVQSVPCSVNEDLTLPVVKAKTNSNPSPPRPDPVAPPRITCPLFRQTTRRITNPLAAVPQSEEHEANKPVPKKPRHRHRHRQRPSHPFALSLKSLAPPQHPRDPHPVKL